MNRDDQRLLRDVSTAMDHLRFIPLIASHTSWAYRVMRGRVTVAHLRANEHTAY